MIWDLFSRIFTWKITKNFEIMNILSENKYQFHEVFIQILIETIYKTYT
jgi:cytochrome b